MKNQNLSLLGLAINLVGCGIVGYLAAGNDGKIGNLFLALGAILCIQVGTILFGKSVNE